MAFKKRLLFFAILLLLTFVGLNWQFFYTQVKYYTHPPVPLAEQKPETKVEPNLLWIPKLGITAPIIYVEEESENIFQEALQKGVVHYPKTAQVGESGNVYIFGHSSDFATAKGNYKTVFALLPKLEAGSTIEVSDAAGQLFRYKVDHTKVISPNDLSVLEQDQSKKQLTLQTSYPVGTALKRYLVIAYIIE
jgi:sortase A